MSTEAVSALDTRAPRAGGGLWPRWLRWPRDLGSARVLRYAFGVSGSMAIAFAFAWPLFFLTPVLTAVFLALPMPAPSAAQVGRLLLHALSAMLLGLGFTLFLLPYPLVYVPTLGLVLFHIYYLLNRGGSMWLVLMALLAVLILPMLALTGTQLPTVFAGWFAWSCSLAILSYALAHRLFPDPPGGPAMPPKKPRARGYVAPAAKAALKSTAVILPLAVLFITLNLASDVLVLVMAAIFSLMPDLAKGRQAGNNSLISTLIGGGTAVFFYWAIVAVPEMHFLMALSVLVMLVFGALIFSGRPNARFMSSAATTLIVLIGSLMADDANFTDVFLTRLLLIFAATLYVVTALRVLEYYFPAAAPNQA